MLLPNPYHVFPYKHHDLTVFAGVKDYPSSQAILTVSAGTHLTTAAHEVWASFVHSGDTVVDATAGNGGDTLWLAKAIGPDGTAHVFDKQVCANTGPTTRSHIDQHESADLQCGVVAMSSFMCIQISAIQATKQKLTDELPSDQMPNMVYSNSCHSSMLVSLATWPQSHSPLFASSKSWAAKLRTQLVKAVQV